MNLNLLQTSSKFKTLILSVLSIFLLTSGNVLSQCNIFYDDFESGSYSPTWSVGTSLSSYNVTTTNPPQGLYSLTGTGGAANHLNGFSTTIAASQPTEISWYMYTNGAQSVNYTVMGDASMTPTECVFFSYWRGSTSEIRFVTTTGFTYSATPNTWYHIELRNIDWTAKTYDIYINGALETTGFEFRSNAQNSISQIHLYNYDNGTGYWDQVIVGATNDSQAPVADQGTLTDVTGECEVTSLTAPTATDNCDGSVTGVHNATLPITTSTTIIWTYTDVSGNSSTQTQDVIIDDITAPVADLASLADVNEDCEVTSLTAPTATDNCDGTITGTHNASLPITSNTTVTWTYEDANGNSITQNQQVNITGINTNVSVTEPTLTADNNNTGVSYQWITCAGTIINGATSQTYTPDVNGDFAVIITEGNCTDTSNCATITTVGLTEYSSNDFSLYPNPTNGLFTVESDFKGSNYYIIDAQGRLVQKGILSSNKMQLELQNAESGIYYLRIKETIKKIVLK